MSNAGRIMVWATVVESYRFILSHPRDLLRVGWLPLIALFALNLLFGTFDPAPVGLDVTDLLPSLGKITANILVQSIIAAAILVAWHRVVLLGAGSQPGSLAVGFGLRELRYLVAWLMLSILFLVLFTVAFALVVGVGFTLLVALKAVLLLSGTDGLLALGQRGHFVSLEYASLPPAVLLATYFASRLSLILPAMATDKPRTLAGAWRLSAGNGWRLAFASVCVMLPVELVIVGVSFAARELLGTALHYPLALASSFGVLLLIVATGTVLSLFSVELDQKVAAAS